MEALAPDIPISLACTCRLHLPLSPSMVQVSFSAICSSRVASTHKKGDVYLEAASTAATSAVAGPLTDLGDEVLHPVRESLRVFCFLSAGRSAAQPGNKNKNLSC